MWRNKGVINNVSLNLKFHMNDRKWNRTLRNYNLTKHAREMDRLDYFINI